MPPTGGQPMELSGAAAAAHTPYRPGRSSDSLASAVDRHDGLCLGSPSDHSSADLRKTALMRSMMRRSEVPPICCRCLYLQPARRRAQACCAE